jgi:hypothetical protein
MSASAQSQSADPRIGMSALGEKADAMRSLRAFLLMTDSVEKGLALISEQ